MERNGLQLTWLKDKLKEVHEMLEQEVRELQENIDMLIDEIKQVEKRITKIGKKPRLEFFPDE